MDDNVLTDEKLLVQQNSPSLLEYWIAVKRCHRMVIIIAMTAVTVAAAFVWIRPYQYTASVRVQLRGTVTKDGDSELIERFSAQTLVESQISQRVLPEVVAQLNLCRRWAKANEPLTEAAALSELRQKVSVACRIDHTLPEILVTDADRATAIELAAATADVFMQQRMNEAIAARNLSIKGLTEEVSVRQTKAFSFQREVSQLTERLNQLNEKGLGQKSFEGLQHEFTKLRQAQILHALRLKAAKQLADARLFTAFAVLTADSMITQQLQQIASYDQELSQVYARYGQNHAATERADQKAQSLQKQLETKVAERIAALRSEQQVNQGQIDALAGEIESSRKAAAEEANLRHAIGVAARNEEREVANRIEIERWLRDLSPNVQPVKAPVTLIDGARIVQSPLGKALITTLGSALAIGIGLGIVLALLRDRMDNSFKHLSDIERRLRQPVMGVIGMIKDGPNSAAQKEAFRLLRNQLEAARADRHFNSLCLVSAGAGEGKSSTVANLAAVWVELGLRVLVVDTDVRRPTLHRLLGVKNEIGVAEYCASDVRLESIIQQTEISGVSLIAAGCARGEYGYITPARIATMARETAKRFDLVIYDTPAALQIGDGTIVAREIGNCLFVVQHHGYPQHMARRAMHMLQRAGARFIGVVVNKVRDDEQNVFFGYSSEYYYPKTPPTQTRPGLLGPQAHRAAA